MAKPKPITASQLTDIVREYNVARRHELAAFPNGVVPPGYRNDLMEALYDNALQAARLLQPALVELARLEAPPVALPVSGGSLGESP